MEMSNTDYMMMQIEGVLMLLDDADGVENPDYQFVEDSIRKYRSDVDKYVVDRTRELNQAKEEYLGIYKQKHNITTYGDYQPLESFDGRKLPVTKEGIAAVSVMMADNALDEYSAQLGALDSIDAFNRLRGQIGRNSDVNTGRLPYETWDDGFANVQGILDGVSVEKLVKIGKQIEGEIISDVEDIRIDFEDFAASADPEMMREGNLHAQYIRTLKDSSYDLRLEEQAVIDRLDFTSVSQKDYRRSPISDIRNYEQLLFGLYDQDANAVQQSGLKDQFEEAVDAYFSENDASAIDLFKEDGSSDPNVDDDKFGKFLHDVSMKMGFSDHEARHFVELLDYEEMRYIEHGEMYASRGGVELTAKGDINDRHKWLFEGFEEIYQQSIDYNVDYNRYLNQKRDVELSEDEVKRMVAEMGGSMEENKPEGGLFDVSLNKRMSPNFSATKEIVTSLEETALLVSQINLQEDDINERFKQLFEQELNRTVSEWGHTEETYIEDADLFVDMMAHTVNRTVSAAEMLKPKEERVSDLSKGHTVIASTLGHNLEGSDIQQFVDNYRLVYDVPMDASLKTYNQVEASMGRPTRNDVAGEVAYYDLYQATSDEDVRALIAQRESQIQRESETEIEREVSDSLIDYNEYLADAYQEEREIDEGPDF